MLLDHQVKLAPSVPRAHQENQEQKVSEDSQDQWSVMLLHAFCLCIQLLLFGVLNGHLLNLRLCSRVSKDPQDLLDRKDHLDLL